MVAEGQPKPAVSDRRRAANRANAQLSTGPKTAEGKLNSRMNAVAHGIFASTLGIPAGEDYEPFAQLRDGIIASLDPQDQAESVLVDQYVFLSWKLSLVMKADEESHAAWLTKYSRPADEGCTQQLSYEIARDAGGPLLRAMDIQAKLQRMLGNTLRQLKDMRLLRRIAKEALATDTAAVEESVRTDLQLIESQAAPASASAMTQAAGERAVSDAKCPEMSGNVRNCSDLQNEPNAQTQVSPAMGQTVRNEPTAPAPTAMPGRRHY